MSSSTSQPSLGALVKSLSELEVLEKAGLQRLDSRPGTELPPLDFDNLKKDLAATYGELSKDGFALRLDQDALSAALYPQVFKEYADFCAEYGDVSVIPTQAFLAPMVPGQRINVDLEEGKHLLIKFLSHSAELDEHGKRTVYLELNGVTRVVRVYDRHAENAANQGRSSGIKRTLRADKSNSGHGTPGTVQNMKSGMFATQIGAPMSGTVLSLHAKVGDVVKKGDKVAVLSAMKMETVVSASKDGTVKALHAHEGGQLTAGDLILEIE